MENITTIEKFRYSYTEFINYSKGKKPLKNSTYNSTYNSSFYGSKNFEHAMDKATKGVNANIKSFSDMIDKLHFIGKNYSFEPTTNYYGESVDVGLFLSGEPQCMNNWEINVSKGQKEVHIYFNISFNSVTNKEQYKNYGSAILAIVDYLESIGVRVGFHLYDTFELSGKKRITIIDVKKPEDSLNIPLLSFVLTDVSIERVFWFRWLEHQDFFEYGYGRATNVTKEFLDEENIIMFDTIQAVGRWRFDSLELTQKWFKQTVDKTLNDLEIELISA